MDNVPSQRIWRIATFDPYFRKWKAWKQFLSLFCIFIYGQRHCQGTKSKTTAACRYFDARVASCLGIPTSAVCISRVQSTLRITTLWRRITGQPQHAGSDAISRRLFRQLESRKRREHKQQRIVIVSLIPVRRCSVWWLRKAHPQSRLSKVSTFYRLSPCQPGPDDLACYPTAHPARAPRFSIEILFKNIRSQPRCTGRRTDLWATTAVAIIKSTRTQLSFTDRTHQGLRLCVVARTITFRNSTESCAGSHRNQRRYSCAECDETFGWCRRMGLWPTELARNWTVEIIAWKCARGFRFYGRQVSPHLNPFMLFAIFSLTIYL